METTETIQENLTATFADHLYKNMKMGSESVLALMPRVDTEDLRSAMTAQLSGYEEFATRAREISRIEGEDTHEENPITRFSAKIGMTMNTLVDKTASHIAEMMIQGSTMAITDTIKLLRQYENREVSEDCRRLARDIITFEEKNVEKMKAFL